MSPDETRDPGPPSERDAPAGEAIPMGHAAQCLMWAQASRRRLNSALALAPAAGDDRARVERDGELLLGMLALDQALSAARRLLGPAGEAGGLAGDGGDTAGEAAGLAGEAGGLADKGEADDAGPPAFDLPAAEDMRERVRGVRNVITHAGDRLAANLPASIEIADGGVRARQRGITVEVSFVEWDRWLEDLEALARHRGGSSVRLALPGA